MKIIAVYHSKGGVGKTATSVNLSYLAAHSGAKTLLCDLDAQGSATYYFRIKPKFKSRSQGLLKGGQKIEQNIKGTDFKNLDLMPSDLSFRNLDLNINNLNCSQNLLSTALNSLVSEYDYIFLDCPPNLTILSENIFYAADFILVPIIPTTLALRSYIQLIKFFKKKHYDRKKILLFFSMIEKRKKMHSDVSGLIERNFKRVLNTRIPYRSEVEKMGAFRAPVPVFAANSVVSKAYQNLWNELYFGHLKL